MFLVQKEKNSQEIIKINITKIFSQMVCFFNRNIATWTFLITVLKTFQIITKTIPEKKKHF